MEWNGGALLLDAAADLNGVGGRPIVLFVFVPAGHSGLRAEVREREGRIEIEVVPTPMVLEGSQDGPVAVAAEELPPLTDRIVRDAIERTRR